MRDCGRGRLESAAMSWAVIVLFVVFVLIGLYLVVLYNGLVQKRNRVENAWAQIDVQLRRRRDLIPNLVEAVKGYAAHERGTFDAVTQARAAAAGAQTPAAIGEAEGMLSQALGRLFAVAEAYPDLKANQSFLDLQEQLSDAENKIAISRQVYNDTVLTYNNAIQVFPAVCIAGPLGFKQAGVLRARRAGRSRDAGRELPAPRPMRPVTPRPRSARGALVAARRGARARRRGGREVVHAPAGRRQRAGGQDGAVLVDERISYSFDGPSRAPTATSRSGRARRSPASGCSRAAVRFGPAAAPSSAARRARARSASSTSATSVRIVWHYAAPTRCARSRCATRCAGSRSPTTTWSTSTSRSGATSGR